MCVLVITHNQQEIGIKARCALISEIYLDEL